MLFGCTDKLSCEKTDLGGAPRYEHLVFGPVQVHQRGQVRDRNLPGKWCDLSTNELHRSRQPGCPRIDPRTRGLFYPIALVEIRMEPDLVIVGVDQKQTDGHLCTGSARLVVLCCVRMDADTWSL